MKVKVSEVGTGAAISHAGEVLNSSECHSLELDEKSEMIGGGLASQICQDENSGEEFQDTDEKKYHHLFVFVHGFQASSADMRTFRNHLQIVLPDAMFLVSAANERDTDSKIEVLGVKLADEVQEFIFTYLSGMKRNKAHQAIFLKKLTFVGHSLGGIIIREALKHLKSYSRYMHAFVSLGSPHLGYMYNSSSLIDAGMWFLKKWKKSESLQ